MTQTNEKERTLEEMLELMHKHKVKHLKFNNTEITLSELAFTQAPIAYLPEQALTPEDQEQAARKAYESLLFHSAQ